MEVAKIQNKLCLLSVIVQKLKTGKRNTEIRSMSRIEAAEIRSLTGKNCHNLVQEFNVYPWSSSPSQYEVSNTDS